MNQIFKLQYNYSVIFKILIILTFMNFIFFSFSLPISKAQEAGNKESYIKIVEISEPGWIIPEQETIGWGKSDSSLSTNQVLSTNDDLYCYAGLPSNKTSLCGVIFTDFGAPTENKYRVKNFKINITHFVIGANNGHNIQNLILYVYTNDGTNMSSILFKDGNINYLQKIRTTINANFTRDSSFIKKIGLYWQCFSNTSNINDIVCIDQISLKYDYLSIPHNPEIINIEIDKKDILLKWNPPAFNGGSNIIGYKIYRGLAEGNEKLIDTIFYFKYLC